MQHNYTHIILTQFAYNFHIILTQIYRTQNTDTTIMQHTDNTAQDTERHTIQNTEKNTYTSTEYSTENNAQAQHTCSAHNYRTYSFDLYHEQIYIKNNDTIEIYTISK